MKDRAGFRDSAERFFQVFHQRSASYRCGSVILILAAWLVSACQTQDNRPVVTVDGATITQAEYKAELDRVRTATGEGALSDELLRARKANLVNELIEQQLILQQADYYGVSVTDAAVQARMDEYRADYPAGAFESMLRDHAVDADSFHEHVRVRLLMEAVIDKVLAGGIEPDDEEIEKYYRSRKQDFSQREKIRLHQILVQNREEAEAIRSRVMKDEKFADLARQHSLTPEKEEGGDLGYVTRDEVPIEFGKAFALELDQVSTVVSSPYGYHIFLVTEKVPARVRSFDEVRDLVRARMVSARKEAAYEYWLGSLRQEANIRIYQDVVDEIK